jgi:hypothetical protein
MYEFIWCTNSYVRIHTKILWTSQTLPEGIFRKEYHRPEAFASGQCVILRKRFWTNQTALINSSQFKIITNWKWILQSSPVQSWLQQCQRFKVKWRCVYEQSDKDNLDGVSVPSNILECDSAAPSLSSQASACQACAPKLTRVPTPRQRRAVRTCHVWFYKTHHIATTLCNDVRGRLCQCVENIETYWFLHTQQ